MSEVRTQPPLVGSVREHQFTFPFSADKFDYGVDVPFVGQHAEWLDGLDEKEKDRALGSLEHMLHGRLCGPSCLLMIHKHFYPDSQITHKELINYRYAQHGPNKDQDFRSQATGRYHQGLVEMGKRKELEGFHAINEQTKEQFLSILQDNAFYNRIAIFSVSPGFDATKGKGGHLVVVTGFDHATSLVTINDPIESGPITQKLDVFLQCRSGKYISFAKTSQH